MSPSNVSPNSQRRHSRLSSIDEFWWVCMLPSICIGLGFGLVALVVVVLVITANYPMPMTTKLVLQATALLAHLLAAAIAAYVAPFNVASAIVVARLGGYGTRSVVDHVAIVGSSAHRKRHYPDRRRNRHWTFPLVHGPAGTIAPTQSMIRSWQSSGYGVRVRYRCLTTLLISDWDKA